MFHTSTQKAHWVYRSKDELVTLRDNANKAYQSRMAAKLNINSTSYMTNDEESKFLAYYEQRLWDFCRHFRPPPPPNVTATALMYFKRFYLNNTPMDYSPRNIYMACVWLATKVEEFNVSISQFVGNLREPPDQARRSEDLILALELPIISALKYHLTIHNPYRPMEGFLIDMRVRCDSVPDVDVLRTAADEFLQKAIKTDAALLFPPSIIAITACLVAASSNGLSIDKYIMQYLFNNESDSEAFNNFKSQVKKIRSLVKKAKEPASPEEIAKIKAKWMKCRNPEKTDEKLLVFVDDEDDTISVPVETIASFTGLDF